MLNITDLKIYIVEENRIIADYFKDIFSDLEFVEIINSPIQEMLSSYAVECVISPANSYGLMTGGFDRGIILYTGFPAMENVRSFINNSFLGEQPICTSFLTNLTPFLKIIHTPTMQVPSVIKDPQIVYHCTRSSLLCAMQNNIKSLAMPVFGTGTGNVDYKEAGMLMHQAFLQLMFNLKETDILSF